ncbi:MAG: WD40 repeat domain-containing protein, partial [Prosthecobacter sp.]
HHPTPLMRLRAAPDGRLLAEAGADKMLRIRDAATLAVAQEFRAHDRTITALAWHPCEPVVATGSADQTIRLWHVETGRRLAEFAGLHGRPSHLAFSPSGQRLGASCKDMQTRIWDLPALLEAPASLVKTEDGWSDLMRGLSAAVLRESGWEHGNGTLVSAEKRRAVLPFPGNYADKDYDLRIVLQRLGPGQAFHLILPVGGRMTGFEIDGFRKIGPYTTLLYVDGRTAADLPGARKGEVVKDSATHDLTVRVRLQPPHARISTFFDDQPLYEWAGLITALDQGPAWSKVSPPAGTVALGSFTPNWAVHRLEARTLNAGEPAQDRAKVE